MAAEGMDAPGQMTAGQQANWTTVKIDVWAATFRVSVKIMQCYMRSVTITTYSRRNTCA